MIIRSDHEIYNTIEETVAKDFEVETNSTDEAYETAKQKYSQVNSS